MRASTSRCLYWAPRWLLFVLAWCSRWLRTPFRVYPLAELDATEGGPDAALTQIRDTVFISGHSLAISDRQVLMQKKLIEENRQGRSWIETRNFLACRNDHSIVRETRPRIELPEGLWMGGFHYSNWFHWMLEACGPAAVRLADDKHPSLLIPSEIMSLPNHIRLLEASIPMAEKRIRWVPDDATVLVRRALVVRPLVHVLPHVRQGSWPRLDESHIDGQGIREFARLLLGRLAWSQHDFGSRVLLSRASGTYRLGDEQDAVRALDGLGFRVVDPGDLDLSAQVSLFHRAEVVVGATGAGWANMVFAGDSLRTVIWAPSAKTVGGLWSLLGGAVGADVAILEADVPPLSFNHAQKHPNIVNPERLREAVLRLI